MFDVEGKGDESRTSSDGIYTLENRAFHALSSMFNILFNRWIMHLEDRRKPILTCLLRVIYSKLNWIVENVCIFVCFYIYLVMVYSFLIKHSMSLEKRSKQPC